MVFSKPTVTSESLQSLALKHNYTTGKWLLRVSWTEADNIWQLLVQGLLDGKFSDELGVLFIRSNGNLTTGW